VQLTTLQKLYFSTLEQTCKGRSKNSKYKAWSFPC